METTAKTNIKLPISQLKNKGGAPKKRVRRELIIRIRMTATERFQIDTKAKDAGMRSSSWIRAAAKSAKVVPRLTADERRILWMLAELANNLNQLTKLAHQRGLLTVVRDCNKILNEIDITLKHLNNNDRESDNG
jgi:ketol-acid reductoisomerase